MNTITIRGIEPELGMTIKSSASRENLSVNQWVLKALKQSTGLDKKKIFRRYDDLNSLAGGWTKKESSEFLDNTRIFEKIDEKIWQ